MPRLRTVSPRQPGWTRRRVGAGFSYVDHVGRRLPADEIERIKALAIPPAWTDVWICRYPNGHLQAVGSDEALRRQYLYHPAWREQRDRMKFDRVLQAAAELPSVRRRVQRDLRAEETTRSRALATAFRLLDLGYFRIGSDAYADAHGSFGLTTLQRGHVRRVRGAVQFRFTGKSGVKHIIDIDDPEVIGAIEAMRRRRSADLKLLAYRDGRRWRSLAASDVNDYLAELFDADLTAKDFRTWHATVLAAASLADTAEVGATAASRRRAVKAAVAEVASYLGNTPTIAKNSYIDPRVLDLYDSGTTAQLPERLPRSPMARQAAIEKAALNLLS